MLRFRGNNRVTVRRSERTSPDIPVESAGPQAGASLEYAAGCLGCTRRQLTNWAGSGKITVQVVQGERRIPDAELGRLEALRGADPDFYAVWDEKVLRWVNTRYAARLTHCSADALADAARRGEVVSRRVGNTLEFDVESLGHWCGEAYRGGPVAWDLVRDPLGEPVLVAVVYEGA